jgi:two-component system CheB/CheR fusion protein
LPSSPAPRGPIAELAPSDATVTATILVVEDDPEVRDLLGVLLRSEGHRIITAKDGIAATGLPLLGADRPDLILADYNLPNGMNGLQLAAKLRQTLSDQVPIIILTGDISTSTLTEIARQNCLQLNKPVKVTELSQCVQVLLAARRPAAQPRTVPPRSTGADAGPVVFVVDDDHQVREAIRSVLEEGGYRVEAYSSCEDFLAAYRPGVEACLLIDARLPGMDGLELLQRLHATGDLLPAIMITGSGDVPTAVKAMKAGASDFIEKPFSRDEILAGIARALEQSGDAAKLSSWRDHAAHQVASLTERQRQIMDLVLAGHPSKNIATDLGISQRTVENHRASIMHKTGVNSLPALARLAVAAAEAKPLASR